MTALRWIAAALFVALAAFVLRAYDSVALQLAWDRMLAFCGH